LDTQKQEAGYKKDRAQEIQQKTAQARTLQRGQKINPVALLCSVGYTMV
jgi:hypothetical protein